MHMGGGLSGGEVGGRMLQGGREAENAAKSSGHQTAEQANRERVIAEGRKPTGKRRWFRRKKH
jgi:hypothetical protein